MTPFTESFTGAVNTSPSGMLSSPSHLMTGISFMENVISVPGETILTLSVLSMGNNADGYQLVPASPASHAGTMAYLDAEDPDDNIVDMIPAMFAGDLDPTTVVSGSGPETSIETTLVAPSFFALR